MAKERIPSHAQARQLASVWSTSDQTMTVMTKGPSHSPEPYNDATTLALVKYGWFTNTGEKKTYHSNGTEWDIYKLNDKGIDALEDFLRAARYRR